MPADTANAKHPGGRPSIYTDALADEFCARLMEGGQDATLRKICADPAMPAVSTIMLWIRNNSVFAAKYHLAREIQDDVDFDGLRDIASTPLVGTKTITKGDKTEMVVGDNVERSKLILHAEFWRLARRNHKKFGDKLHQEHSGPDGGPIQVNDVSLTDAERLAAIAAVFDAARDRKSGSVADDPEDVGAATGPADRGVRKPG